MWGTGIQDLYSAPFTVMLTAVHEEDGVYYYDWYTVTSDSDGGYEELDGGPAGSYSSSPADNTGITELNDVPITIPEDGVLARAWLQGDTAGGPRFTCEAPPQLPTCGVVSAPGAGPYGCTTSMADVGLSIAIPAAGTYVISATVEWSYIVSTFAGSPGVQAQLYDATNSVALTGLMTAWTNSASSSTQQPAGQMHGTFLYEAPGPCTIELQALYYGTDFTSTPQIYFALGETWLTWFKLPGV